MLEHWKDIPGYEGRYQVSDLGRVRSVDRLVEFPRYLRDGAWRSASLRKRKGVLLRPGPMRSGHLTVALGRGNSRQVHQLVLLAFVGPCPEGHEVLHLDHDPKNNRLDNLKYGTRSENIKMDYAAGRRQVHPNLAGSRWRHARSVL
jgi:hypothetical protein